MTICILKSGSVLNPRKISGSANPFWVSNLKKSWVYTMRQEKTVQLSRIPLLARKVVRFSSFQVDEFKGTNFVNQVLFSELEFWQE